MRILEVWNERRKIDSKKYKEYSKSLDASIFE